jgi:hypothetical protein
MRMLCGTWVEGEPDCPTFDPLRPFGRPAQGTYRIIVPARPNFSFTTIRPEACASAVRQGVPYDRCRSRF